jgi:GT2 family glycosyltransferase
MDKVVTIIVTYNGSKWIRRCLEQLLESSTKTDIMILDNNSSDNTLDVIAPFLKKIKLIKLSSNLGFGGANNIGIQEALDAAYSHIFLLNQDAYVRPDTISKLLITALENPDYGIISPLQLNISGKALDQVFGNQVRKQYNPDSEQLKLDLSQNSPSTVQEVKFAGAASWFVPAEVFKKVGLFHPQFFHYGEDNNFAARAQYYDFKIGIQVTAAVLHDRKPRELPKFLPTKLRTFPLHQLLDIRKPFFIAWLVGYYQLMRTWSKLKKISGEKHKTQYLETRKWFFTHIKKAREIRIELKEGHK